MRRPQAWARASRWSPSEVPLSVELGPGLIASIYDGIQRPLDDIMKISGNNLKARRRGPVAQSATGNGILSRRQRSEIEVCRWGRHRNRAGDRRL